MESYKTFSHVLKDAVNVLLKPSSFYREMSKSGGVRSPLIFILTLVILASVMTSILALPGEGVIAALLLLVKNSVLWSLYALVASFVTSVVLFVIWKNYGIKQILRGVF